MNISSIIKPVAKYISKHAPTIFIIAGAAGLAGAGVMVGVATPKYIKAIEKKKEEKGDDLTFGEKAKTAVKYYAPAAIMTGASAACVIAGTTQNAKRNAALVAGYKLAEESVKDYKKSIEEQFGEKKANEIETKVMQKKIDKHPISPEQEEHEDEYRCEGPTKFYDPYGNRYFYGDIDDMKRACHNLMDTIYSGEDVTLDDFFYLVGVESGRSMESGRLTQYFGWKYEEMLLNKRVISFKPFPCLDKHQTPCIGIGFSEEPDYLFK